MISHVTGANFNGIIEKPNKSRKLNIMNLHSYQPQDHVVPLPEAGTITAPRRILVDKIILSCSSSRKGNKMWFDDASKEIASY